MGQFHLDMPVAPEGVGGGVLSFAQSKLRRFFSLLMNKKKKKRSQCPRSHEQTPLCSALALQIHPQILETWGKLRGEGWGCTVGSIFVFDIFFFSPPNFHFLLFAVTSGFGAECEQLDEGAEEGVQPALVGHALLHHFLLARVFSCLFNGVGLGGGIHTYSASRIMDEMTHHKCCVCLPPSCTVRRCGIYNDAESGRDCRSGRNLLTVWCPKIEMRIWEQCFKQQRKKKPKLFQKWIQFYESQTALKTHSRVGVLYHLSHTPHTFTLKLVFFF